MPWSPRETYLRPCHTYTSQLVPITVRNRNSVPSKESREGKALHPTLHLRIRQRLFLHLLLRRAAILHKFKQLAIPLQIKVFR